MIVSENVSGVETAETIRVHLLTFSRRRGSRPSASGGIADGRGLVAALALGAEGISMGTRFMCTQESPIHPRIKDAIVAATELIFRPLRNTSPVASNSVSREAVGILANGGVFEDVKNLVAGSRGRRVYTHGDPESGVWTVGMVQGLIHDVPGCSELVARIVQEAEGLIQSSLSAAIAARV